MRIRCYGPRHEPEGCEWYCPLGTIRPEGKTWDDTCEECRAEIDRWANLYDDACRDTTISPDLKDRGEGR